MNHTLSKNERLCKQRLIERLFQGGRSRSMAAFPVRAVFMMAEKGVGEPKAQVLMSVSKRLFKNAVDRNRAKRQMREAYRKNKQVLDKCTGIDDTKSLLIAFIWMDSGHHASLEVEKRIKGLLERICEKLCQSCPE